MLRAFGFTKPTAVHEEHLLFSHSRSTKSSSETNPGICNRGSA